MALNLGAHHALRVDTRDPEEMARRVEEALGCKPDVSVECSGAAPSVQTGIYVSMTKVKQPQSKCQICLLFSLAVLSFWRLDQRAETTVPYSSEHLY